MKVKGKVRRALYSTTEVEVEVPDDATESQIRAKLSSEAVTGNYGVVEDTAYVVRGFEAEDGLKDFEVDICRIGYGYRTVNVRAVSMAEAREKAEENAGSWDYSEKDSDYKIEDVREV